MLRFRGIFAVLIGVLILLAGLIYLKPQVGIVLPVYRPPAQLAPTDAFLRLNITTVKVEYQPSNGTLEEKWLELPAIGAVAEVLLYGGVTVAKKRASYNGTVLFKLRPGVYQVLVSFNVSDVKLTDKFEIKVVGGVETRIKVRFLEYTPILVRIEFVDENANGFLDLDDPIRVIYAYRPVGLLKFSKLEVRSLTVSVGGGAPQEFNISMYMKELYAYFETPSFGHYYVSTFQLPAGELKGIDIEAFLATSVFTMKVYRVWWGS